MAEEKTYRRRFEEMSATYAISAREYFMILRLVIYHCAGVYLDTSHKITQYEITEAMYRRAIAVLKMLGKE